MLLNYLHSRAATESTPSKLILGTHTSNGEQNYLMIASINLPHSNTFENEVQQRKGGQRSTTRVDVTIKINHQGEVHRARYMPHNPFIIATKSPSRDVCVFDVSKHPSLPKDDGFCPEHKCVGHTKEGYGLAWNPHIPAELLSSSDDGSICVWDLNQSAESVPALKTWTGHSDVAEDVSWHQHSPHVFGSVGDDMQILIWDTRGISSKNPFIRVASAHDADIHSIAFNPHHEFLVATSSTDRLVKIWDMRNTSEAIHCLHGHEQEVLQVQWAPFAPSVLASCGADRRTRVWDLTKVVACSSASVDNAAHELLFVHGGHNDKISDLSWNPMVKWAIATVSDDNILQVWRMDHNISREGM
mmetsp:Transcript_5004/g.15156  ORF Transcript_5004/g.15156 Transcript_5004/m.15156 type:complete len:358 (-) Transcript_5004:132-1205(-)